MASSTGTWSSVGSTDDDCYCTNACSFTYDMCDLAVEAISNDELGFSDSDIDDMYDDCTTVHDGCLDECNGEDGYDALSSRKPEPFSRRSSKSKQRNHHYTFEIDDNGLDINGFIIHSDKGQGKRHKFRVYLDSDENGRFDKNDQLIGRTGLKQKHAAKGVGNLLDEDEIGQVKVKFKRNRAIGGGGGNIAGAVARDADINDGVIIANDLPRSLSSFTLGKMSFIHPDGDSIVQINKNGNISQAAWDIGLENM